MIGSMVLADMTLHRALEAPPSPVDGRNGAAWPAHPGSPDRLERGTPMIISKVLEHVLKSYSFKNISV